jgi:ribonucleoside-diphosphate reductase alpha subunit
MMTSEIKNKIINENVVHDTINKVAKGLKNVDLDRVKELVNKFGLDGAARILGYEISHYNNLLMAGRLVIEHIRNIGPKTIFEYAELMKPRLNVPVYNFIMENHEKLQKALDETMELDYDHDWFSANTMMTMYSVKYGNNKIAIETPQYIWMRVAIQLYHSKSVERVLECYKEMITGWYTPASPTLFNSGLKEPSMSSCYLLTINDNLESILKVGVYYAGMITKASGGLGIDVSRVRHSEFGNNGESAGIVPMLRVYNDNTRYVKQGPRRGAATIFLRPYHLDAEDFISLPCKVGEHNTRAHDLNFCLWTPWIFWQRIQEDGNWTLFCPAKVPQLDNIYGTEFAKAYIMAENDPTIMAPYKKVVKARSFYDRILDVQRETGMPYLMNGDACNIKSNQRHMGYIRCSNLCLEIVEYTDEKTIAVCNLSSLSLRMFANGKIDRTLPVDEALPKVVNYSKIGHISAQVTENLNSVIDENWYPLDKIKNGTLKPNIINKSNKKHRPIGIGASGFAEMLHILDLPFEDPVVRILNKSIFACMYWNALAKSVELAIKDGPYESFPGSPTSQGRLQFDLWKEEFEIVGPNQVRKQEDDEPLDPSFWGQKEYVLYASDGVSVIDTIEPTWDDVKRCIMKYGLRNSLLLAPMPTASTAQVRRNCESLEAHQNNMYSRNVLTCSYPVLNRYLLEDLEELGLWNFYTPEFLKVKNGSIQGYTNYVQDNPDLFPNFTGDFDRIQHIEKKYKTMWEISQKTFLQLAADRGRYIDQSQSTNIYISDCTDDKLRACHLYSNSLGLKTIMYYLRQKGEDTIKFTADPSLISHIQGVNVKSNRNQDGETAKFVCTDAVCVSCQ